MYCFVKGLGGRGVPKQGRTPEKRGIKAGIGGALRREKSLLEERGFKKIPQ